MPLKRARILLVEDNAFIALSLANALRNEGATVVGPYSSLADASHAAQYERAANIALLDLALADGDGSELALALEAKGIPVVIMTGLCIDELHIGERVSAMIEKPFTTEKVTTILRGVLGGHRYRARPVGAKPRMASQE